LYNNSSRVSVAYSAFGPRLFESALVIAGTVVIRAPTFNNSIDGTALLAESTIDALGHVDIVSRCPPRPILTLLGLDGDGLSGTDGLTELAGDAAFLTCGISTQGVFTPKSRGDGAFFKGIIYRVPKPSET
jgi:hypothetical protein